MICELQRMPTEGNRIRVILYNIDYYNYLVEFPSSGFWGSRFCIIVKVRLGAGILVRNYHCIKFIL
jgi:hypothetical protein